MIDVQEICTSVSTYDPSADLGLIQRSYEFAAERHAGQRRRSGDPYVVHPVGVARIISQLRLDVPSFLYAPARIGARPFSGGGSGL